MPWIRIISGTILTVIAIVVAWNVVGHARLDVDENYSGKFREGPLEGKSLSYQGVVVLKEWIESRTRPTWDPFQIAWHQLWYNAVTEHYELKMWIEPPTATGHRYGVYLSGNTLFLRREYSGRNRVLSTSFTSSELAEALEPYSTD